MAELVNQPSKLPTRKLIAIVVSGAILGGASAILNATWPDHPFGVFLEEGDQWIQLAVITIVGYMTKNKAPNVGL
jgi:hypothetical protein